MLEPCFSNLNFSITDNFSWRAPSDFLGKLFHKIALLPLEGAYLFGETEYLLIW